MTQLPFFSPSHRASAWAWMLLAFSSPPRRPPRKSLQLTEEVLSDMEKEMMRVWPFLASFMSKSETSPRTVMRPMSSVISRISMMGS